MIHPHTEIRFVNPSMGYGVFASQDIPRGTIVYVRDPRERELTERLGVDAARPGRHAYADEAGVHLVGRDHSKYVNHRCDPNTLATAYGFEIAVRTIWAGQELSADYGLFGLDATLPLLCGCSRCRRFLRPDDLETHYARWDERILAALDRTADVHQPLMHFMDEKEKHRLRAFLCGEEPYVSVRELGRAHRIPAAPVLPQDNPLAPSPGFNG